MLARITNTVLVTDKTLMLLRILSVGKKPRAHENQKNPEEEKKTPHFLPSCETVAQD